MVKALIIFIRVIYSRAKVGAPIHRSHSTQAYRLWSNSRGPFSLFLLTLTLAHARTHTTTHTHTRTHAHTESIYSIPVAEKIESSLLVRADASVSGLSLLLKMFFEKLSFFISPLVSSSPPPSQHTVPFVQILHNLCIDMIIGRNISMRCTFLESHLNVELHLSTRLVD